MTRMDMIRKVGDTSPFTHNCPVCASAVRCDITRGKSTCWCFTVQAQIREAEWDGLCLCTGCLKKPRNPE